MKKKCNICGGYPNYCHLCYIPDENQKEDFLEEIKKWAYSEDCDCELSWETFYKCCGKSWEKR